MFFAIFERGFLLLKVAEETESENEMSDENRGMVIWAMQLLMKVPQVQ